MRILSIIILLFLSYSCGDDDMKKYYRLEGLRVLAIEADTPEINSPATVSLTPYISYTDGGDTTLDIAWEACIDPGISYGAEVECSGSSTPFASGADTFTTSSIGSANFYTGQINAINVAIPASAFVYLGTLNSTLQFNGYDVVVIINISDQANSNNIKVFKRIKLTTKTSGLNANPTISGFIQNNETDLTSYPTSKANLTIDGLSLSENYTYITTEGTVSLNENMLVTWFSNVGEFQFSRANRDQAVEYTPSGTSGVIVGVYRDNRGGVSVIRKVFP